MRFNLKKINMAKITVTYDNAAEAATGAACIAQFGADVMDVLVTNWLAGHAANIKQRSVETLLKAADVDATFKTRIDKAVDDAKKINEANKPPTPLTPPTPPGRP